MSKIVCIERNLIAASGKENLSQIGSPWEVVTTDYVEHGFAHCEMCHARIRNVAEIKNQENEIVLLVGLDCAEIIQTFQDTRELKPLNPGQSNPARRNVSHVSKEIGRMFRSWFRVEFKAGRLPASVAEIFRFLEKRKFIRSLAEAEVLVEYYKEHRLFETHKVLSLRARRVVDEYSLEHKLPTVCSIDGSFLLEAWLEKEARRIDELQKQIEERTAFRFAVNTLVGIRQERQDRLQEKREHAKWVQDRREYWARVHAAREAGAIAEAEAAEQAAWQWRRDNYSLIEKREVAMEYLVGKKISELISEPRLEVEIAQDDIVIDKHEYYRLTKRGYYVKIDKSVYAAVPRVTFTEGEVSLEIDCSHLVALQVANCKRIHRFVRGNLFYYFDVRIIEVEGKLCGSIADIELFFARYGEDL